jgi:hypothetical protein
MVDSVVRMTTREYSVPCIAMAHFVEGGGIVSEQVLVDDIPASFIFDHVEYRFQRYSDTVLFMKWSGLDREARLLEFIAVISKVDFRRWQEMRRTALGLGASLPMEA